MSVHFGEEITGGVTLVIPAIQSANYVSGVSGWALFSNGNAEINETSFGVQTGGDIGGTDLSPEIISTHLSAPLPVAQGGTGNAAGQPSGSASGDLGGTYPGPTVTGTHLSAALPVGQGGTGNTTGQPSGSAAGSLTGTYPAPGLASTAVTAGSYVFPALTVGADGRLTAAASSAVLGAVAAGVTIIHTGSVPATPPAGQMVLYVDGSGNLLGLTQAGNTRTIAAV